MFINFTNFYQRFVKDFSKITTLITLLLNIIGLSDLARKAFTVDNKKVFEVDSRINEIMINLSKNLTYISNIGAIREATFLIFNTKKVFNHLKQAFIKALIL